ncbi:hypothetical protein IL306_004257 [Fusarium sp. DS 682]|nr:hypothetical protein IL306_004257 [Fusarium sp. DS 682]
MVTTRSGLSANRRVTRSKTKSSLRPTFHQLPDRTPIRRRPRRAQGPRSRPRETKGGTDTEEAAAAMDIDDVAVKIEHEAEEEQHVSHSIPAVTHHEPRRDAAASLAPHNFGRGHNIRQPNNHVHVKNENTVDDKENIPGADEVDLNHFDPSAIWVRDIPLELDFGLDEHGRPFI